MISDTPTESEIKSWVNKYNVDVRRFFNVNGKIFKENNLKDRLHSMSLDESCSLLSQNGMLIKRPIYIDDSNILFGFKEEEWSQAILKK